MSGPFQRAGRSGFRNEFAWSVTRRRNFMDCRRRYYFAHYAHWNGWRSDAPERTRRCYVLGKMTTLPMWAGQIVHETIEDALRALRDVWPHRKPPNTPALKETARRHLRRGWKESRDRAWERDPKRCVNLFEHYFHAQITKDDTERVAERVYGCIDAFAESEILGRILATDPMNWLTVEEFHRFELGDFRVVVRLDAAVRDGPRVVVVDWKTGREDGADGEQLRTYALAAVHLWNVAVENVGILPVYLASGKEVEGSVSAEEAIEARERIYLSCHEMASLLVDGDIERNEPLPEEEFAKTDDRRVCARCAYQELCYPEDALPVHATGPDASEDAD